jgi:MoaA/NifB/PqqE/SkfB family radical SAM enzyme
MENLNILPGYLCNLKCTHCLNNSGPDRFGSELTPTEKNQIISDLKQFAPPKLTFTGGEPTLYIALINELIDAHPSISDCDVWITTNGKFALSFDLALATLKKFQKLDRVQMSLDIFHGNILNKHQVENLNRACESIRIPLVLTMAISNPLEIVIAKNYTDSLNIKINFQKVGAVGRARENGIEFKYETFEPEVLSKKCPNNGAVAYIAGKGYSSCCSSLVFDHDLAGATHKTLDQHLTSPFRQSVLNKTMEQLAFEKNLDLRNLPSEFSSVCRMCEWINLEKRAT